MFPHGGTFVLLHYSGHPQQEKQAASLQLEEFLPGACRCSLDPDWCAEKNFKVSQSEAKFGLLCKEQSVYTQREGGKEEDRQIDKW